MKQLLFMFYFITIPLVAKPLIIGHRGASSYEPENTLRSFKRAIDMGVDMIELDVFVCKSGELVVMHDDTIDRTTNGKGNVMELTWNTLKKYDAGKGERIPLLSEVFDLVDKRITVDIELKGPNTASPVAQLINHYIQKNKWAPTHFLVSSFDHYAVRDFHTYCPLVKTGVIFDCYPIGRADIAERADACYAIMHNRLINKAFITDAHARGIKVFAYEVNTKSLARKLEKLNIDGIITDSPDILR